MIVTYNENSAKYRYCCCHIKFPAIGLGVIGAILSVAAIGPSIAAIVFRTQVLDAFLEGFGLAHHFITKPTAENRYSSRNHHKELLEITLLAVLSLIILGSLLHMVAIAMLFASIKIVRPSFCIPEMALLGCLFGIELLLSIGIIVSMAYGPGSQISRPQWACFGLSFCLCCFFGYFLYILVRCHRFLEEKRLALLQKLYYRSPRIVEPCCHVTFLD